jgi:sortase A
MTRSPLPTGQRARRRRRSLLARGLEACLWTLALATLGPALWMAGDACLYQWRNHSLALAAGEAPPGAETAPTPIPAGTPIARLSIPRLDFSAVVAEGATAAVLRRAVGHLPASALPGGVGNVALAGHRDTFFRSLRDLREGDVIVLDSAAGRDSYRVEWMAVVEPSDVDVVAAASRYPALTLVTCYPFRYVGSAPHRFVVRARRLTAPVRPPAAAPSRGRKAGTSAEVSAG